MWLQGGYFRQFRLGIVILLRVEIARNPPRFVVGGHGKLRVFLLDGEVVEVLRQRELVAETQSVVIKTETEVEPALLQGLAKTDEKLVVVVADVARLAPYGLPGFVKGRSLHAGNTESAHQIGHAFRAFFARERAGNRCRERPLTVGFQLQTEVRGPDNAAALVRKVVGGTACGIERKVHNKTTVGRNQPVTGG